MTLQKSHITWLVITLLSLLFIVAVFYLGKPPQKADQPAKLWQDSIDSPAMRIFFTGQTHSFLEVCGCSSQQEGGVGPRATLLQQLSKDASASLVLDGGGLIIGGPSNKIEPYDITRARYNLTAMEHMGYEAVLLAGNDLRHGFELLAGLADNTTVEFISANLAATGGREKYWLPFKIVETSAGTVAVIGLTRSSMPAGDSSDQYDLLGYKFLDARKSLQSALTAAREFNPDMVVLLCDYIITLDYSFLSSLEGIDLIMTFGSGEVTGAANKTPVLFSAAKGRRLRWADVSIGSNNRIALAGYEVSVSDTIKPAPHIKNLLKDFYDEVINAGIVPLAQPLAMFKEERDTENMYVGPEMCQECHMDEYIHWKNTYHSVAYNRLFAVNRYYFPNCYGCHVTGAGQDSGFIGIDKKSPMAHVSCEACHGPGGRHTGDPRKDNIRGKVRKEICAACHTPDNDSHFEEKYEDKRKIVLHKKLPDTASSHVK
jgi:2',3'-cyclic-nucleotide 2'-phosphodiesterase (5'-nucleotidase family)